jgi:hypothetical protein
MNKDKNQEGPNQERKGQSSKDQNEQQSRDRSSQQAQDRQANNSQPQGEDTQSGEWKRPLTNQDEQRKTTNAGNSDSPMGEEETEGDPGEERIKPYKNIGDDSEEVEKKTPSM